MRLSELTGEGRFLILSRINRELKDWKRTKWWQHKQPKGEAASNMFRWFQEFSKFRRKVLDNHNIGDSLSQWIGHSITDNRYNLMCKINVPQLSFLDDYQKAIRLWELANESENIA